MWPLTLRVPAARLTRTDQTIEPGGEGWFPVPFPLPPSKSKQFSGPFMASRKPSVCGMYGQKPGTGRYTIPPNCSPNVRHSPNLGSSSKKSPGFGDSNINALALALLRAVLRSLACQKGPQLSCRTLGPLAPNTDIAKPPLGRRVWGRQQTGNFTLRTVKTGHSGGRGHRRRLTQSRRRDSTRKVALSSRKPPFGPAS